MCDDTAAQVLRLSQDLEIRFRILLNSNLSPSLECLWGTCKAQVMGPLKTDVWV